MDPNTALHATMPDARRWGAFTVGALLANLACYAVASVAGATWAVDAPVAIGPLPIAGTTLLAMGVGALVATRLVRRNARYRSVAAWGGLAFALLTTPSPFFASSDATSSLALAAMHVVTGAAWFLALRERSVAPR